MNMRLNYGELKKMNQMKVHNLCFNSLDFLKLVEVCEGDEIVFLQCEETGCYWKGWAWGLYRMISRVRDEEEIEEIMEHFK